MNRQIHVLLVEDDDIDAMMVEKAFDKAKVANPLTRAVDGVDALEKLRSGEIPKPYMILLDINMPRMNGLEFLDEIRKDEDLKDAIVFVFTTSQDEKDVWKAYQHNIAAYLLKDNVGRDFMDAIDLLGTYWRIVEFP